MEKSYGVLFKFVMDEYHGEFHQSPLSLIQCHVFFCPILCPIQNMHNLLATFGNVRTRVELGCRSHTHRIHMRVPGLKKGWEIMAHWMASMKRVCGKQNFRINDVRNCSLSDGTYRYVPCALYACECVCVCAVWSGVIVAFIRHHTPKIHSTPVVYTEIGRRYIDEGERKVVRR